MKLLKALENTSFTITNVKYFSRSLLPTDFLNMITCNTLIITKLSYEFYSGSPILTNTHELTRIFLNYFKFEENKSLINIDIEDF